MLDLNIFCINFLIGTAGATGGFWLVCISKDADCAGGSGGTFSICLSVLAGSCSAGEVNTLLSSFPIFPESSLLSILLMGCVLSTLGDGLKSTAFIVAIEGELAMVAFFFSMPCWLDKMIMNALIDQFHDASFIFISHKSYSRNQFSFTVKSIVGSFIY
mgnify:CR=1 FL=1